MPLQKNLKKKKKGLGFHSVWSEGVQSKIINFQKNEEWEKGGEKWKRGEKKDDKGKKRKSKRNTYKMVTLGLDRRLNS